jgi:hypothetical protein
VIINLSVLALKLRWGCFCFGGRSWEDMLSEFNIPLKIKQQKWPNAQDKTERMDFWCVHCTWFSSCLMRNSILVFCRHPKLFLVQYSSQDYLIYYTYSTRPLYFWQRPFVMVSAILVMQHFPFMFLCMINIWWYVAHLKWWRSTNILCRYSVRVLHYLFSSPLSQTGRPGRKTKHVIPSVGIWKFQHGIG